MALAFASRTSSRKPALAKRAAKRRPARTPVGIVARPAGEAFASRPTLTAGPMAPPLQMQLEVGGPHDKFEQEADRVADRIVRAQDAAGSNRLGATTMISRLPATQGPRCPTEPIDVAAAEGALARSGSGHALAPTFRTRMEAGFGADFSHVRVHTDLAAGEAARALKARAFTRGSDVYLARGESPTDRRLMGHELTHVVQQSEGSAAGPAPTGTVQRRLGDGHDLESPWLAGDLRLEDIFDDDQSKFLRQGSRGTSVKRVQQLLFFLGFDIGPAGADGIFGPDTDAAVRAFQTQFAPPVDGIIGPITIGALDRQANQPEPNRTAPGAPPPGPPVGTPPSISVDRIDVVDSPAGAIGGFPGILGNADLNAPGAFNDPTEVKNVHQIHFHLDHGSSADLTPAREIQRTSTLGAGTVRKNPPDEVLPPGVAGPTRPGGFTGVLIGPDGPGAHEIQRPSADKIVVADAPGFRGLVAANFPVTYRAHFILTVSDTGNAPIARINYDVLIDRRTQADVPNTENRIFSTAKRDFVRGKTL